MKEMPPSVHLFEMITAFLPARAIQAAAQLGIADLLTQGPRAAEELAQRTGSDPEALYRLLRALASVGIFAESEGRTFGLTPMAELLRSDVPGSMRSVVLMIGEEVGRSAHELVYSVQTGRPAFEKVFGAPIFGYLSHNPERGRIFDEAMAGIHGPETQPVIDAYDFSKFGTLVDVGGGNGSMLLEILRTCPGARGVVFDLAEVAHRAEGRIRASKVADRCRAEGGDFFREVPAGGDIYILRHIIHDFDDDRSVQILRRCREAAGARGKVLIIESVIPPGNEPHPGKWLDMIMLLAPGGKERTAEEFEALLARAGLKLTRIVPTVSPVSIVESVPA